MKSGGPKMEKNYWIILAFGFCLCSLLISTGCDIEKAKYQRTENLSVPLEPNSTLVAETSFGSITVTGADVADCNITATISVKARTKKEAKEIAEKVKIKPELLGKILTVRAEKPQTKKKRSISVNFNITVPEQTNIECSTSYGSIKLADINGNIKAKTSFASINSEDIQGAAQLETSYGNINCQNITSTSLKAKTSFSSIKCENIQGPVQLETSYGSINCRNITSADIAARSSFGSIDIACSPSSPAEIIADVVTSYGSIDFVTPPSFSGQLDLSTSFGSIKTSLPIMIKGEISKEKVKGTIGQGKGKLRLKTSFDSIRIK